MLETISGTRKREPWPQADKHNKLQQIDQTDTDEESEEEWQPPVPIPQPLAI